MMKMTNNKISVSANILFGKPRIKGTRISVEQVLAALAEGMSQKDLTKEFGITAKDVQGCMDYAHKSVSRTHFVNTKGNTYA